VLAIVQDAFDGATTLLRANRAVLDRCAQALIERETLDEADMRAMTRDLKGRTPKAALPAPAASLKSV
jgi:cell division protease FtsH